MTNPRKIYPPWSTRAVNQLKHHQHNGRFHPYMCENKDKHINDLSDYILIPTIDGWTCPSCDYRQAWAWRPVVSHDR